MTSLPADPARPSSAGPERPVPILQVGVIGGSRPTNVEAASFAARIGDLLTEVAAAGRDTVQTAGDLYAAGAQLQLRCISSLASAEERLAARAALALGFGLQVPLPSRPAGVAAGLADPAARRDFEQLLDAAEVVAAIETDPEPSEATRAALLGVILDQSDVLLVLAGDGEAQSARREARARNIAVVEIGDGRPHHVEVDAAATDEDWRPLLRAAVTTLLDPFRAQDPQLQTTLRAPVRRFFAEDGRQAAWYARIHTLFERAVLIGWRPPARDPQPPATDARQDQDMVQDFAWADRLAIRYAHLYRSAFVLRYLLILPMAVGMTVGFFAATAPVRTIGFGVQLLAVVGTLLLTYLGKRTDWHERFTTYRFLAELLRHQLYLGRLGRTLGTSYAAAGADSAQAVWVSWHFRAIVRRAGLRVMDQPAVDCRQMIDTIRALVDEQGAFYRRSASRYQTIANRVWQSAVWLFWIDFVIITVRGAVIGLMRTAGMGSDPHIGGILDWAEDSLNELDIMLPSMAWIILALGDQGEYSRLADQYAAMAEKAASIHAEIDRLEPAYPVLARVAMETAAALTSEVANWRVLVSARVISYL